MNSDRFVVNRRNLNPDESNYWLQNNKSLELANDYFQATPITRQVCNIFVIS